MEPTSFSFDETFDFLHNVYRADFPARFPWFEGRQFCSFLQQIVVCLLACCLPIFSLHVESPDDTEGEQDGWFSL